MLLILVTVHQVMLDCSSWMAFMGSRWIFNTFGNQKIVRPFVSPFSITMTGKPSTFNVKYWNIHPVIHDMLTVVKLIFFAKMWRNIEFWNILKRNLKACVVMYSEKAWACVQCGITQRGRLANGDMTMSPQGELSCLHAPILEWCWTNAKCVLAFISYLLMSI